MEHHSTINIINILKQQYSDSKYKALLHKKSGEYYDTIYSVLSIINITLLSITTISKIITDIYTDTNIDDIVFTVLIAVSTALSSIIHFLNYSELSVLHINKSLSYTSIYQSIDRQMIVPTENIQEYYSWITKKYDTLLLQLPDIPKYIQNKYKKEMCDSEINNNLQVNIDVNPEVAIISKEEQYQIDRWIANE
jgi:hypothetical protein